MKTILRAFLTAVFVLIPAFGARVHAQGPACYDCRYEPGIGYWCHTPAPQGFGYHDCVAGADFCQQSSPSGCDFVLAAPSIDATGTSTRIAARVRLTVNKGATYGRQCSGAIVTRKYSAVKRIALKRRTSALTA